MSKFRMGIYFADLVSKSAQYCYTNRDNPVGLMLLSEVALGEMYELKNAKYMEKFLRGKHSTKRLGKTIPQDSGFVKWRDDVVVPCGKPISSNTGTSTLMYNEYIVYNAAQDVENRCWTPGKHNLKRNLWRKVKLQFLLKVGSSQMVRNLWGVDFSACMVKETLSDYFAMDVQSSFKENGEN